MAYRALTDVLLGNDPPARAGELIPDTYKDLAGCPQPVDFDRLVKAGAAEKADESENLDAMTRAELDELACDVGIEEPGKLANKQAVIDAIDAARSKS